MDGNFIDNNFDSLIESADILPEGYTTISENGDTPHTLKYDKFSLRIKFSQFLDPNSVNQKNAVITRGNKHIKTSVEYDKKRRSIIISPKNRYLRNTLYILRLSGKVMSEKGRSLRENRFFVFRQDGDSLKFYKGLRSNAREHAPDTLNIQKNFFLPFLFFVSAIVIVVSYFYANKAGLTIGTALVFVATAAAFIDSISDIGKSHREYIYGAKLYNSGFYFEAIECFERALHLNPENAGAKYGLDAAIIKCSEVVD